MIAPAGRGPSAGTRGAADRSAADRSADAMGRSLCIGIDVGSTQTKGIIIDERREIIARALGMTGANVTRAAENCFIESLKLAGIVDHRFAPAV